MVSTLFSSRFDKFATSKIQRNLCTNCGSRTRKKSEVIFSSGTEVTADGYGQATGLIKEIIMKDFGICGAGIGGFQ